MRTKLPLRSFLLFPFMLALGCAGEPVPIRVSGSVVNAKDKGIDGTCVVFFPLDARARTAMTSTSPDGSFSLDVYPGEYGLGFSRLKGGKTLQNFMSPESQKTKEYQDMIAAGKSGIPPANTLPDSLMDAKTSGISVTVAPGMPAPRFTLPVNE